MSGTFIIGTNGRIELPYYYDHIADHPALELLLEGVLSTKWTQPFDGPVGVDSRNRNRNRSDGKSNTGFKFCFQCRSTL